MIDIEIDLFDEIATDIYAKYPDAFVSSEYVAAPPRFPAASVIEQDNAEVNSRVDTSGEENAANVSYEVNVYSNLTVGAKGECKAILAIIDKRMRFRNMTRLMSGPVDNKADPSVTRYVARYAGTVDKEERFYRR